MEKEKKPIKGEFSRSQLWAMHVWLYSDLWGGNRRPPQNCPSAHRRPGQCLPLPVSFGWVENSSVANSTHCRNVETHMAHIWGVTDIFTIRESLSSHRIFCRSYSWNQRWTSRGDTGHQELLLRMHIVTFTDEMLYVCMGLASRYSEEGTWGCKWNECVARNS